MISHNGLELPEEFDIIISMEGNRKVKLFIVALVVSIVIFGLMLFLMNKSEWISLYDRFNGTLQWLFGLFVGGNGVEHISKKVKSHEK